MNERNEHFSRQIGAKADRKLEAKREISRSIWFGFGMSGLIGWAVAVPTLLGAGIGLWLDRHYPGSRSWTLALLMAGLVVGCWTAWRWVARQDREIHAKPREDVEPCESDKEGKMGENNE
ncbi:AtpZ/AtpI family protein [Methylocapsa palsarum]|uniref:ATP synthase protein I n=1 Tax=Methylocapsa palsarum TaxID=1612308 RepID=A0A1I4CSD9_9HYPH|nr:AtpZ/AtpI family protein [Methylocapsa palsarum]SFK84204.1 ATP synthase protein I [Methylocapsa palsarum]